MGRVSQVDQSILMLNRLNMSGSKVVGISQLISRNQGSHQTNGDTQLSGVCRACNVRTELPRPLQLIIASQSTGRIIYDVTDECDQIGGGL